MGSAGPISVFSLLWSLLEYGILNMMRGTGWGYFGCQSRRGCEKTNLGLSEFQDLREDSGVMRDDAPLLLKQVEQGANSDDGTLSAILQMRLLSLLMMAKRR